MPAGAEDHVMQHYNKLVRDGIPDLIAKSGRICDYTVLSPPIFRENLDDKLEEELSEFRQSRDLTELMDIVEVIQAIVECEGGDWADFERARDARRAERGGFRERIWLRSVR
jgi:predicted house-cleaning noncanonical NTP pyrophosphatase (MazG superfamily)